MRIICLKGGLGNQMFIYCRYLFLKEIEKHKSVYIHYDRQRLRQHGAGVEIDKCFRINLPREPWWVFGLTLVMKLCRTLGLFRPICDDNYEQAVLIDDFCQDKRFLLNPQKEFIFGDFTEAPTVKQKAEAIKAEAFPVAIHVRRGDYLHPQNIANFGILSMSYYKKAVEQIVNRFPEAHFFVFSDDMAWVKANFALQNASYLDTDSSVEPAYTDMYLMSLCKGHIIANSTYSFWGAWLAQDDLVTIYPTEWYQEPTWSIPDIFREEWVGL